MAYLLDTNTCVQHLRNKSAPITRKLVSLHPSDIRLCSAVRAELQFGALRSADPTRNQELVEYFCQRFISLPFDGRAADINAVIRIQPLALGQLIGPNDLLIAAITMAHDLTLVTHNTREFIRVKGLEFIDWEIG